VLETIIAVVVGVFVVAGSVAGYTLERRDWNNGYCARCCQPWRYFDTDSQGGRGYECGCRTCWISYPGIDQKQCAERP